MTFDVLIFICFIGALVAAREVFWKEGEPNLSVLSLSLLACSLTLIRMWLTVVSNGFPTTLFGVSVP